VHCSYLYRNGSAPRRKCRCTERPSPLYSLGFDAYNSVAVLSMFKLNNIKAFDYTSTNELLAMVAVSNLPQVLISCLYLAYNSVYTSMASTDEWSRLTVQRKALRTTNPVGIQRSTFWLSLPWTYNLAIAAAGSVLNWLISRSVFRGAYGNFNVNVESEQFSYMEVGCSPLTI
jgi:hypothetical protein